MAPSQPPGAAARYDGRVEHLVSSQVARCHALEALLAFMTRALADMFCTPTQGGPRPRAVEAVALEGLIPVSSKQISYGHLSDTSGQSPLFLRLSLKSTADMQALLQDLPPLLPQIAEAADTIGTLHQRDKCMA